ncbi:MAG: hypothetical protein AB9835_14080 [Eubacteriales bacterium]
MELQVTARDMDIYRHELSDFLPQRIIDVHTHIWLKDFRTSMDSHNRGADWPFPRGL